MSCNVILPGWTYVGLWSAVHARETGGDGMSWNIDVFFSHDREEGQELISEDQGVLCLKLVAPRNGTVRDNPTESPSQPEPARAILPSMPYPPVTSRLWSGSGQI